MTLFDAHCHLEDEAFSQDRDQALLHMRENGVAGCVDCGSDLASSLRACELACRIPEVYAAAGIHPHECLNAPPDYLDRLTELLHKSKTVALGEIGLDYHYDRGFEDAQKRVLREQIELAVFLKKPAVFHIREAHGDMLQLFREMPALPGGVIHCFSGSAETAMEYVRMGFYISFAGTLTFKKAPNLERACALVPLDRLLIETDSPYLAPEPHRGKRNEPANVLYVLKKMALLRGIGEERMAEITTQNAKTVYGLR